MPNGQVTDFTKLLAEWQKKHQRFITQTQTSQANVRGLEAQYRYYQTPIRAGFRKPGFKPGRTFGRGYPFPRDPTGAYLIEGERYGAGGAEKTASQIEAAMVSNQIREMNNELLKNIFYTDLYATIPALVISGAVDSVDQALSLVAVPEDLTEDELAAVRNDVTQLLAAKAQGMAITPTEAGLPELEPEGPIAVELPELVPPEAPSFAVSIHKLSVDELVKSLQAPKVPETAMTRDEWLGHLRAKGWSDEDIDKEKEIVTQQLVAEAQNRKNLVESFRSQAAEMPEQTLLDIFKMSIINPPLVALEALGIYYEHVSMPASGWLYGNYGGSAIDWIRGKRGIPDIKKAYEDFKKANPEASEREAYVHAWKEWDAPGPPVLDFILKYLLMEGVVDPLSYAGWGFITKGLRALGPAGRVLARGNRFVGEVLFEAPFDFAKFVAAKAIPKTVSQQAAVMSRESLSILDRYFELATKKPLSFIKPKDMYKSGEEALEHLSRHPRAEDDVAMAARAMLAHSPVDERTTRNWIERLKRTGAAVLEPEKISDEMILDVDTIFEKVFSKEITVDEAAPHLLRKLGVTASTEEATILAGRFLADRSNQIFSRALDFATEKTANKAMRAFGRKSLKIYENVVTSRALVAATKSGRYSTLFYNVSRPVVQTWQNYVNKLVIRPAAESYLTFGMYGPMNTLEDMFRSILGGVRPGRMSVERSDIITMGLLDDPEIRRSGISEMIGPLRETGEPARSNWILTLSLTPWSVPTYLATRGRITPTQFSKGTYRTLVELFGGLGADIRRNFRNGKFQQILADTGGDAFKALDGVVGDLPPELSSAPKWVKKNLRDDLRMAATTGKLTTDNIDLINVLKNRYTRDKIHRAEVDDIIKRYPDISPTARSMVMDGLDEGIIFAEVPDVIKGIDARVAGLAKAFPSDVRIKSIEINSGKVDAQITPVMRKVGVGINAYLDSGTGTLVVRNAEVSDITLAHELTHQWIMDTVNAGDLNLVSKYAKLAGFEFDAEAVADAAKFSGTTFHDALYTEYPNVVEDLSTAIGHKVSGMAKEEMDEIVPGAYNLFKGFSAVTAPYKPATTPDSINDFMRTVYDAEVDDFLRGPERATAQYDQLTDLLTSLEVQNPEDMAELIVSLHRMTATYGALPDQLMARATIKSRGLPLNDRKLQFDMEFDRLYNFMDRAGANIDRTINRISQTSKGFEFINNVDWSKMTFVNMPDLEVRAGVRSAVDKLPFSIKQNIHSIEISTPKVTDVEKTVKYKVAAFYEPSTGAIVFKNADLVTSENLFHEVAHSHVMQSINNGDMEVIGAFAEAVGSPHAGAVRRASVGDGDRHYQVYKELHEEFADAFSEWAEKGYVTARGSEEAHALKEFFEQYFPKTQRDLGLSEAYQGATQRYLDLATSARKVISEAKTQDMTFRSSYFADATQKDLRDPAFWDSFYASEMSHWKGTSKKLAVINSNLHNAINDINVASGLKMPARAAVRVTGRALAPADVAKLIGTRGDDLSRMLLDNLIPEGDKDYFVEYVMGLVREGYDQGFDRAGIEAVYDQIADSILVDPTSSSWFRSRQKQLESMTQDFHDLYNAKLFPDEQKKAVDKYVDNAAEAADSVIYQHMVILSEKEVEELERLVVAEVEKRGIKGTMRGVTSEEFPKVLSGEKPVLYMEPGETLPRELAAQLDFLDFSLGRVYHRKDSIGKARKFIREMEKLEAEAQAGRLKPGEFPARKGRALGYSEEDLRYFQARSDMIRRFNKRKPEFEDYDNVRQQALDEANRWYYKEYPDYTNANAFDATMKAIYPFWTYESQRWFWLPRSFMRRPGTLTAWGRWEDNTDYGYIHIPGTSIDVNPARGTVYGPWSTRLMRRDYPEYYDELEGMGGMVGFFDFISRYGFYPNVIYGATLARYGGASEQTGGILPSAASTPLNALIAAFPDNPLVTFISEKVFPEMFRQYLTARRVDDLGGDGSLVFAKIKAGQELTEEEQAMWTEARRFVALHSAGFEQFGFARMRSDESYELAQAAALFIEENWGYTPEQQRQLRLRGEKLWDLIGGLDPWETAVLQEMEFFKYSGSINPVLPSKKQAILNRIELDWSEVMSYSESMRAEILELQQDFLVGSARGRLGPDGFLTRVRELYRKRRDFIDEKIEKNPLMLLENRTEYYEKYGDPMPVQSPYNELMDLFFSVELEETVDPATGERVYDWDKFWANRDMIDAAIPAADKGKWDTFLTRHTALMMQVWHDVYDKYLRKYYQLWDTTLETYPEEEQALIKEYLFLERTQQQLERQEQIKAIVSEKTGLSLVSSFRSAVTKERKALRYANPHLDAWLYYWGRVTSFQTPKAKDVYKELARATGRRIEE